MKKGFEDADETDAYGQGEWYFEDLFKHSEEHYADSNISYKFTAVFADIENDGQFILKVNANMDSGLAVFVNG